MTRKAGESSPAAQQRYWIDLEGGGSRWVDPIGLLLAPDEVFAAAVAALSEFAREGVRAEGVWRAAVRTADGEIAVTVSLEIRSSGATFAE